MNYDEIERYISNEMDKAERHAFEIKMAEDEVLSKEVAFYQRISKGIGSKIQVERVDSILEQEGYFEKLEKTFSDKDQQSFLRVSRLGWIRIAASVALIVGTLFWYASKKYSNDALASVNITDLGLLISERVRSDNTLVDTSQLEIAKDYLVDKRYDNATFLLNELEQNNDQDVQILLLLAYSYCANKEYEIASQKAEKVLELTKDPVTQMRSEWLLLKAYIGLEKDEEAEALLQEIINQKDHQFYKKAQQIKQKRNSFWRRLVN